MTAVSFAASRDEIQRLLAEAERERAARLARLFECQSRHGRHV